MLSPSCCNPNSTGFAAVVDNLLIHDNLREITTLVVHCWISVRKSRAAMSVSSLAAMARIAQSSLVTIMSSGRVNPSFEPPAAHPLRMGWIISQSMLSRSNCYRIWFSCQSCTLVLKSETSCNAASRSWPWETDCIMSIVLSNRLQNCLRSLTKETFSWSTKFGSPQNSSCHSAWERKHRCPSLKECASCQGRWLSRMERPKSDVNKNEPPACMRHFVP